MEVIMNDSDSKDFLRDISAVHPEYKESCSAVTNLIILLMEELQKERKGRKRGEKLESILGELENCLLPEQYKIVEVVKRKYFQSEEVKVMDLDNAIVFIRQECLSYQLPKDKDKFDKVKGEVLDFLQNDVVENKIRNVIEVDVLASNNEVIEELAEEIEIMTSSRRFDKGAIRVVSTRWVRD